MTDHPPAPATTASTRSATWCRVRAHEEGQATAEYALVMLAAAALAGMVLTWAVSSDGIARLMNAVVDSLIAGVTG